MSDTLEMESVVETLPVPRPHRERSDIKPFVPDGDRAAIYRALSTQIEIGGTAVDAANRIKQALTALERDFNAVFGPLSRSDFLVVASGIEAVVASRLAPLSENS